MLAGQDDVGNDRLGGDDPAAAPKPQERTTADQLPHCLAHSRQDCSEQEEEEGVLVDRLPPVQVAELAPQRRGGRGREEVCRHDPGELVHSTQVADDRERRGGDNPLLERAKRMPSSPPKMTQICDEGVSERQTPPRDPLPSGQLRRAMAGKLRLEQRHRRPDPILGPDLRAECCRAPPHRRITHGRLDRHC